MSLQIDYDKIPYNLRATRELINFGDFIERYAMRVDEMPSHTKEAEIRKENAFGTVKSLRSQHQSFSDMLWENIHLIETIVSNDQEKLKALREKYEKCRNNTDPIRD